MRQPKETFSLEIGKLKSPMVYVFRRGQEVLYVGQSKRGFVRLLADQHHRAKQIVEATRVTAHLFDDIEDAKVYEAFLIHMLKPKYNMQGRGADVRLIDKFGSYVPPVGPPGCPIAQQFDTPLHFVQREVNLLESEEI